MGTGTAAAEEASPPRRLTPPGRLWPFLLPLAAAAAWVDFGSIHARHRDDSLIFPLASLYAWKPFFWEQDRVGLLVPLACSPVRDPWANLLVEVWLTAFMGLSVPLLAAEYARPGPAARWAGVGAAALLLGLAPPVVLNNILFECYYPAALFLGLVGLLVLDRGGPRPGWGRGAVALACFALAHWVYVAVPVGLVGLVVWRIWLGGPDRGGFGRRLLSPVFDAPARAAILLILVGFAFGLGVMVFAAPDSPDYVPTPREGLEPDQWLIGLVEYAGRVFGPDGGGPWLAVLVTVALGGAVGLALVRPAGRWSAVRAAAVLLLAGATEYAVISTRDWPALNDYHARYILGSLSFMGPALLLPATTVLFESGRGWVRRGAAVGITVGLFAAAGWQFGLPSPANARAGLDAAAGRHTEEFLATGADAIGGDYWHVWSSVFHANAARRERGGGRVVVGVAFRSSAWRPVWEANYPGGMRVAVFRGPNNRAGFYRSCGRFGLTEPRLVGSSKSFDLYETRPIDTPSARQ